MSIARAERHLLQRLAGAGTVLCSAHLELSQPPAWADGVDKHGRHILLIGAHALRQVADGEDAVQAVLASLAEGDVPAGVHEILVAPRMAAAQAEILAGASDEVLVDGERGTGKSVGTALAQAMLAECHERTGHAVPYRVLWVHDSLASAEAKTAEGLEEAAVWGGLWQLRNGKRTAAFVLAGRDLVIADFVPTQDAAAAERLKAACHLVMVEEAVASLATGAGVDERSYGIARSSQRLASNRKVAVVVTNPGPPDHWVFTRFISPGRVGAVRCRVPASDRLGPEEIRRLREAFPNDPEMAQRLAYGEWSEVQVGAAVTPGFTDAHIAKERLHPVRNVPLWCGHDGGHTPSTVIASHYQGSVQVYAALASTRAGTRQHVEQLVKPWLSQHAPWALASPSTLLVHRHDPAMATGEQADIDADPIRVLRELLGGPILAGAQSWPGRLEPIVALLGRFNSFTGRPALQVDPVEAADLIRALRGRWHFPMVHGKVSRDLPVKDHPWSDLGDSLAYVVGGMAPSRDRSAPGRKPAVKTTWDVMNHNRGPSSDTYVGDWRIRHRP